MTPLAAYVLLFLAVGVGFIFVHLVAGKLIRPSKKNPEKDTIYECGEPTIGSAWIQFDLRFYVVALLFVIFDVEVAFFFPWAEVFGKANEIRVTPMPQKPEEHGALAAKVLDLAAPSDTKGDRAYWEGVKFLVGRGKAAEEPASRLRELVQKIHEEQKTEAKRLVTAVEGAPEEVRNKLQKLLTPPPPPAMGGPVVTPPPVPGPQLLRVSLELRADDVLASLQGTAFGQLRRGRPEDVELLIRPEVVAILAKAVPKEYESARAMDRRHVAEVSDAAAAVFASVSPTEANQFDRISLDMMSTLATPRASEAKRAADSLAWLAFFEILVFFGVLLVGFAYLWKRGDLAWVRSTAAETVGAAMVSKGS